MREVLSVRESTYSRHIVFNFKKGTDQKYNELVNYQSDLINRLRILFINLLLKRNLSNSREN